MQRKYPQSLSQVIREFLSENPAFSRGLITGRVLNSWDRAMGPKIAAATISKSFRNDTLYCTISSSLLRNILLRDKQLAIRRVNEACGADYVKKIVLK